MPVDFSTREGIMKEWDKWVDYYWNRGGGTWPRDAFESLLDWYEEKGDEMEDDELRRWFERFRDNLDKMVELLEFMKEHHHIQVINGMHEYSYSRPENAPPCACWGHKAGESTGGWYCPVHGQCF